MLFGMSWIASLHDDVVDDDVRVFVCVGECFVCAQEGAFLVLTFVMRGAKRGATRIWFRKRPIAPAFLSRRKKVPF